MTTLKKLSNGFEYIEIENSSARAKIALQGAHVFEYERKGEDELFWLSEISDFERGKAIRGGVPICWPSFGMNNPELPQHGFARTSLFKCTSREDVDADTTEVELRLTHSEESLKLWNYKYELVLKVTISDKLAIELKTINRDEKEFKLTQALHSYFRLSDISNAVVRGLDKKPCFDALRDENSIQNGDITFNQEFDKVFQHVDNELLLQDKEKTIKIKNEGSSSVVVWNPWIEKCKRMSAMKDEAYREFVCIESANAFEDFVVLKPKEEHTLIATIKY
ncbi:MAG: D-hexose-6-phosphate mutarotase [Campylobacterota bacterium]